MEWRYHSVTGKNQGVLSVKRYRTEIAKFVVNQGLFPLLVVRRCHTGCQPEYTYFHLFHRR